MRLEVQTATGQGVSEYKWRCVRQCATLAEAEDRATAQIRCQDKLPHAARRAVRIEVFP